MAQVSHVKMLAKNPLLRYINTSSIMTTITYCVIVNKFGNLHAQPRSNKENANDLILDLDLLCTC